MECIYILCNGVSAVSSPMVEISEATLLASWFPPSKFRASQRLVFSFSPSSYLFVSTMVQADPAATFQVQVQVQQQTAASSNPSERSQVGQWPAETFFQVRGWCSSRPEENSTLGFALLLLTCRDVCRFIPSVVLCIPRFILPIANPRILKEVGVYMSKAR